MSSHFLKEPRKHLAVAPSLVALLANLGAPFIADAQNSHSQTATASPIKHVIVIIGENRTFDHVFATYKPKHGQKIDNLLSKGIVNEDGTPGPNFSKAEQRSAIDSNADGFQMSPSGKSLYATLPTPSPR